MEALGLLSSIMASGIITPVIVRKIGKTKINKQLGFGMIAYYFNLKNK